MGGLVPAAPGSFGRLFTSPGPIFEPEGTAVDAWGAARGLRAAGFRPGDIVLNTLARETQFRTEAMTSRIAQLAIIDTLIACLALADYERSVSTIRKTFEVLSTKRV